MKYLFDAYAIIEIIKGNKNYIDLEISGKVDGKRQLLIDPIFGWVQRVVVSGVNVLKKSQKPRKSNEKGQIIDKTMPIHVSNVKKLEK